MPESTSDAGASVFMDMSRERVFEQLVGPLGSALVRFRLEGNDPTEVIFDEAPERGVIRALGSTGGRQLLRLSVWGRNQASLEQLKARVEEGQA